MLTVFQCVTMENWVPILYAVSDIKLISNKWRELNSPNIYTPEFYNINLDHMILLDLE